MRTWVARAACLVVAILMAGMGPVVASLLLDAGPVAAASCLAETEPDDQPDTAVALAGSGCLEGSLPDGDAQDTWVWTVDDDAARQAWTITLAGVPGTATEVELVPITSPPGATPIVWTGQALATVTVQPGQASASVTDQLIPAGRYVLGVGRTSPIGSGPPASFDYRIELGPGAPLPPAADAEPNDDVAHAVHVRGAFEVSGDSAGTLDDYAWRLDADAAAHAWDVVLRAGLGTHGQVQLLDEGGGFLTSEGVDATGVARIYDLRLPAGTYVLDVVGDDHAGPQPYVLSTVMSDVAGSDPEPDDDPRAAVPISVGALSTGRLARGGDVDQYLLSLDGTQSQYLLDVRLLWQQGPDRRVCVSSLDKAFGATQLQCSSNPRHASDGTGRGGVALGDLYLRQGDYLLTVTGDPDPQSFYSLRLETTTRPTSDFETEPDDQPSTAMSMAPTTVMRGWATAGDTDVYRVVVTGDPQVWTVRVAGSSLDGLSWIDPLEGTLSVGDVSPDRSEATLADAYLPPGEHLFRVTSDGGDYTLSLTPQGPPNAQAELEPDDDATHAVVLLVDRPMFGRLPGKGDVDVVRFSLAAPDHIGIELDVPPDGAFDADLRFEDRSLAHDTNPTLGASWADDLRLQPGDYELWLRPETPSASSYRLTLTREDPFAMCQDQEPNGSPARAGPMPPSLQVSGTRDGAGDEDWFRLGSVGQPATITVRVTGAVSLLTVSDGKAELPVSEDGPTQTYTIGPTPTGVPLYLHVIPAADYSLSVSGIPAPDGPPVPAPPLAVTLDLSLPHPDVAAYWSAGQELSGDLTITSTAATDEVLALDAVTSHYAWTATLGRAGVTLAPGASVVVPVTIDVLPDAWADIPVRIAGARHRRPWRPDDRIHGGHAEPHRGPRLATHGVVRPRRDAGRPRCRGHVLGRRPAVPSVDPVAEAHLYDGIEHTQGAFTATTGRPAPLADHAARRRRAGPGQRHHHRPAPAHRPGHHRAARLHPVALHRWGHLSRTRCMARSRRSPSTRRSCCPRRRRRGSRA
ncbi:MAG: hypothetical protein R3C32_08470 [Chloroflexota bacterium]